MGPTLLPSLLRFPDAAVRVRSVALRRTAQQHRRGNERPDRGDRPRVPFHRLQRAVQARLRRTVCLFPAVGGQFPRTRPRPRLRAGHVRQGPRRRGPYDRAGDRRRPGSPLVRDRGLSDAHGRRGGRRGPHRPRHLAAQDRATRAAALQRGTGAAGRRAHGRTARQRGAGAQGARLAVRLRRGPAAGRHADRRQPRPAGSGRRARRGRDRTEVLGLHLVGPFGRTARTREGASAGARRRARSSATTPRPASQTVRC